MTKETKTHWVSLFIDRNMAFYFDSFGIEYILQKLLNKIKNNSVLHTFRVQSDDSVICGFYCVAVKEYIIAGKLC